MYKNLKRVGIIMILITILTSSSITDAKTDEVIVFKDKKLEDALSKFYNHKGSFTKKEAADLSEKDSYLDLVNDGITDLEGLQYFKNLVSIYSISNDLNNLQPISELNDLIEIFVIKNNIKGKPLEEAFMKMGQHESLSDVTLKNNGLTSINFLDKIGYLKNYTCIIMQNNEINDISILKEASKLNTLDLSNNRITDVTPLKNLKKLTTYLDLHDNCIIDYKPIKPLLDEMYSDFDYPLPRYDFYTNPVNYKYNGKEIDFPYLTVYYEYEGYAEAAPLFKALGGSAEYDKKTGTLTCQYDGLVLVFKDFSKKYTLNGVEKSLDYPMRRMQYDLAYVPVKDICKVLGLEYKVVKKRTLYVGEDGDNGDDASLYAPKLVEIRKVQKELG